MRKLVLRWEKCIERQGDYVEKYVCQFVAKILHFTSFFRLFKYMVSFPRYFTACITYQPPLVEVFRVKPGVAFNNYWVLKGYTREIVMHFLYWLVSPNVLHIPDVLTSNFGFFKFVIT